MLATMGSHGLFACGSHYNHNSFNVHLHTASYSEYVRYLYKLKRELDECISDIISRYLMTSQCVYDKGFHVDLIIM